MYLLSRLTLHLPDCSRTPGFKSSLNQQVHLKIYHALKETSYLTDGASIADSPEIATTIFAPGRHPRFPPRLFRGYPLFTFAESSSIMPTPAEKLIMPQASQPVDKIKLWPQNQKRRSPLPRKRALPRTRSSRLLTAVSFDVKSGETDFFCHPPVHETLPRPGLEARPAIHPHRPARTARSGIQSHDQPHHQGRRVAGHQQKRFLPPAQNGEAAAATQSGGHAKNPATPNCFSAAQ